ncbi:MAG: AI-2E family transporter [Clostridia bacterium]|nr:AI-2E family transporter [Clostridia bacterium]
MKQEKFNFKFLNVTMYVGAAIVIFYVLKNLGITEKISNVLVALVPVYIGIIICWLSMPLANKLKKIGLKDRSAAVVSLLIIFGIFILIVSLIVPMLVTEIGNLIKDLPDIYRNAIDNVNSLLYEKLGLESNQIIDISSNIKNIDFINKYLTNALNYSINTAQSAISVIIGIFTTIVVSFFMVKDMDKFKESAVKFLSKNSKNTKRYKMVMEIDYILNSYIKGMLLDSFIVGVLVTILCYILGIDYAIIFGILIMVLNLIPYIGALLSEIIITLYALATGGVVFAIITFALLVLIQIIDANILQPNIVAKSVNLHPVVVFAGLIIFNLLFGMFGMIIAVPVIAALKIILKYTFEKEEKEKIIIHDIE